MMGKIFRLNDIHLSAGLDYLCQKALGELEQNYSRKYINKIAVKHKGTYFCKNHLFESSELCVVGHLSNFMNIESFTGVNYQVPVFDYYSPLSWYIANHLHYNKPEYRHKGYESLHRLSLLHCNIFNRRKVFMNITNDCVYCKKLSKRYLEQVMGPLSDSKLTISPVFFMTLVDLWGPVKCFAPGQY